MILESQHPHQIVILLFQLVIVNKVDDSAWELIFSNHLIYKYIP